MKDYQRSPKPVFEVEHTLAVIKAEAVVNTEEIVDTLLKSGFTVVDAYNIRVDMNLIQNLIDNKIWIFDQRTLKEWQEEWKKVRDIEIGFIRVMHICGLNGVVAAADLAGPCSPDSGAITHPTSLRARFGRRERCNAV